MATYIHHIETVVPDAAYPQALVGEVLLGQLSDRKLERLGKSVYRSCAIEQRHSVIRDLRGEDDFFLSADGRLTSPTTKERNERYTAEAKRLFACAAHKVVAGCPGVKPSDITHVITVSCTGFFAPGPEYHIVRELGLPSTTERYHLGFMGCYASFPALKMAQAFCEADPDATVLIVSLELCTLHLRAATTLDELIATCVFADGGGAAIVSAKAPASEARGLELRAFASSLVTDGEADMAWTIGDEGFEMVLSTYVPELLGSNIAAAVEPVLTAAGQTRCAVDHWAVHPGGRAILDKVQSALALGENALEASRKVLRTYGNMSSATIFFVLQELLGSAQPNDTLYALAFGPGLTVESGLFRRV